MTGMKIRQLKKEDNVRIAQVIRHVLEEHGVNKPGTVYTDPTTDDLFQLFKMSDSIYWILEVDNEIIGGCGIYPTKGLPKGYGELVKLYLLDTYRGKGLGKKLMMKSIESAREFGYKYLYLETMPELSSAIDLYRALGFESINHPLGDTGHFACEIRMVKQL